MKNYIKLILTSLLVLSLTSCSLDLTGEKDKKIAELEKNNQELKLKVTKLNKEAQEDIFKKKQECRDIENKITVLLQKGDELNSVFYSPIKKSCIATYIRYETVYEGGQPINEYPVHIIRDILTLDWIFKETDAPKWEEKIKELKGEQ